MKSATLVGLLALMGCSATDEIGPCPKVESEYYADVKLGEYRQILYARPSYLCVSELRRNAGSGPARVVGIYSDCTDINDIYSGTFVHTEFFDLDADSFEDLRCAYTGYMNKANNEVSYYFLDECGAITLTDQQGMDVMEQRFRLDIRTNRDLQGAP